MLMLIYFLIIIFFEIRNIYLGKTKKDKKHFKIVYSLFFSSLISAFINCIYGTSTIYTYNTGEWIFLFPMLTSFGFAIINFIVLLITLFFHFISKKSKKYKNNEKSILFIKNFFITIIITLVIIVPQYIYKYIQKRNEDHIIINETMQYLEEKYETSEFEVTNIDRNFSANGFISTDNLEYYLVHVVYLPNKIEFVVELNVDDNRNIIKDDIYDTFSLKQQNTYEQ